ncbi:GrpB family protein [Bhargavaea cecembensis]|uniref:GrpB family protein n=2 Tax=Bhargavaea cecembensis TaxID=394098 RepID=UPI0006931DF8|nr:GrpB family protein [Bhargavaea cecembensis]
MEGLPKGKVFLVPDDGWWADSYRQEAELLGRLLGPDVRGIEHIGSTAVPGIRAKPLVDLLVGVEDLEAVDGFDYKALAVHGYYKLGNKPIDGKRVLAKFSCLDPPVKTHVVHVVEQGGRWWREHIRFRDRLRGDPALAGEYEELKQSLAARYPGDEAAYADAKLPFVRRVLAGEEL